MSKPLTKEQADWLIEQLDKGIGNETNLVCSEIVEIINECTEKEFPGFAVNDINNTRFLTVTSGTPFNHKWVYISSGGGHLDKEQFKLFADGINKIVEWLEQE